MPNLNREHEMTLYLVNFKVYMFEKTILSFTNVSVTGMTFSLNTLIKCLRLGRAMSELTVWKGLPGLKGKARAEVS